MTKTLSTPTEVTLIQPGQPSAGLVAELKAIGERLTVKQLAHALGGVEAARVGFAVEAIATGILLLAKKASLKHGEWLPLCAAVWAEIGHSGSAAATLGERQNNFTRSLRSYCFVAQHFLADLEQGNFQPEISDQKVAAPEVQPTEVLALDTLPEAKRIAVYAAIERFIAGRSLRRMLIDFRRAEGAADQEEIDEASKRRGKKPGVAGGSHGQLDFYEDMLRPLGEIDTLFDTKSFVEKTDKAFWTSIAEKLETQARRARQMAKEVA